jgi:hypothetical protein
VAFISEKSGTYPQVFAKNFGGSRGIVYFCTVFAEIAIKSNDYSDFDTASVEADT